MPTPATRGPLSKPAPRSVYPFRVETPGEHNGRSRSEWAKDGIDVLTAALVLAAALITLL